jgi:hypothetical protein
MEDTTGGRRLFAVQWVALVAVLADAAFAFGGLNCFLAFRAP